MGKMKAYDKGLHDGRFESRKDRVRTYESDRAEKEYWRGYLDSMIGANPGKLIVQCEREGRIFATDDQARILCPTCGRTYIKEPGTTFWESDRKLTILHRSI
jgi:hypothetical protein